MKSAPTLERTAPATRPRRRAAPDTWRGTLDRGIGRARMTSLHRLAGDLAVTQERCQHLIGQGEGYRRLPYELDRELHLLSVRLSDDLDSSYRSVSQRTLVAAFDRRHAEEIGRDVADRVRTLCADRPDEVLLVTACAGVSAMPGTSPLRATVTGAKVPVPGVVEVALTAGCYVLWSQRADVGAAEVSAWLQTALDSVAAELLHHVVTRYHAMRNALMRAVSELSRR